MNTAFTVSRNNPSIGKTVLSWVSNHALIWSHSSQRLLTANISNLSSILILELLLHGNRRPLKPRAHIAIDVPHLLCISRQQQNYAQAVFPLLPFLRDFCVPSVPCRSWCRPPSCNHVTRTLLQFSRLIETKIFPWRKAPTFLQSILELFPEHWQFQWLNAFQFKAYLRTMCTGFSS